jgi:hypothetical protein
MTLSNESPPSLKARHLKAAYPGIIVLMMITIDLPPEVADALEQKAAQECLPLASVDSFVFFLSNFRDLVMS